MFNNATTQYDLQKEFSQAILKGDKETIKKMFDESNTAFPDIDLDLVTAPAILIAAQQEDWEMLEILYELGANLNAKNTVHDWYLIQECLKHAPDYIFNNLVDCEDVDLNVESRNGKTPAMVAIEIRNFTRLNKLIDSGRLEWSQRDKELKNLAHYAAQIGDKELFIKLVKSGVSLQTKDKFNKNPLDYIEDEMMKKEIIKELDYVEIDESNEHNVLLKTKYQAPVKKEESVDDVPKVTGLSKIKRK